MPINSAICVPRDGDAVTAGPIEVQGYAIAYGRQVARVEVSADAGETWQQARFVDDDPAPDVWRRWAVAVELAPGSHVLAVRAVDDAGQSQPSEVEQVWNFAGYLSTVQSAPSRQPIAEGSTQRSDRC